MNQDYGQKPWDSIHIFIFKPSAGNSSLFAHCCVLYAKENVDLATVFFLFNFKNEACVSTDR